MDESETQSSGVTVLTGDYSSDRNFADFPLSSEVLKGLDEMGYKTATAVQAATMEPGLAGKDLLVRSKTGTGKTAAFCIPTVERIDSGAREPRAVILAPTRELAQQVARECGAIAKHKDLEVAVLVGGLALGPQEDALRAGAAIIVGTPGRVLDHMRRRNLDLSTADHAILDEADEMLSMGFYEDVRRILDATNAQRQVLMFSATIDNSVRRLIESYLADDKEEFILSTDTDKVENIEHILYETSPSMHKARALLHVLEVEEPTAAIIFCNTREDTRTVFNYLDRQGLDAALISGELPQAKRSKVIKAIKSGQVQLLVATDVAARGLDINDLTHVFNYSLPQDAGVYLHRAGRTGRIGKKGKAIALAGGADLSTRLTLENQFKIEFDVRELPTSDQVTARKLEREVRRIKEGMEHVGLFESYLPSAKALAARSDGALLLAVALRGFFLWDRDRRGGPLKLDEDDILPSEEERRGKTRGKRDGDHDRKRSKGKKAPKAQLDDLDALLDEGSPPDAAPAAEQSEDDKPKKKRRRRRKRRKKGPEEGAAVGPEAEASEPATDAAETKAPADDLDALLESSEAPADDLDALLETTDAPADDLDALLEAEPSPADDLDALLEPAEAPADDLDALLSEG